MNMYVYVSMHSLQKGGESPSFHQELVASMHSLQKGGEYANRDDHVYCTGVSPNSTTRSPWMPRDASPRCCAGSGEGSTGGSCAFEAVVPEATGSACELRSSIVVPSRLFTRLLSLLRAFLHTRSTSCRVTLLSSCSFSEMLTECAILCAVARSCLW